MYVKVHNDLLTTVHPPGKDNDDPYDIFIYSNNKESACMSRNKMIH